MINNVPVYVPLPVACARLRAVDIPQGASAELVIEAQHTTIMEYEAQIKACASLSEKALGK